MKSKIRIEYDFDKKEPYLEIRMPAYPKLAIADKPDSGILPDDQPDLRDSMLKSFIQELGLGGKQLVLRYSENNTDNSVAKIYLQEVERLADAGRPIPKVIGHFTRRSQLNHMIPAEKAIYNAMQELEKVGAHPILTRVSELLSEARESLADWVETEGVEGPAFV